MLSISPIKLMHLRKGTFSDRNPVNLVIWLPFRAKFLKTSLTGLPIRFSWFFSTFWPSMVHLDSLRKKRILVIEDDSSLRQAICHALMAANFQIDFAIDGKSGLELALQYDFDAIVLDRMLPGMDGLDLMKSIKQVKNTPIIMATAKRSVEDRIEGLDSGAEDYLVKPYSLNELVARMNALFRRAKNLSD